MDGELERILKSYGLNVAGARHLTQKELPDFIFNKLFFCPGMNDVIAINSRTVLEDNGGLKETLNYFLISHGLNSKGSLYDCIVLSEPRPGEPAIKQAIDLHCTIAAKKDALRFYSRDDWCELRYDPKEVYFVPAFPLTEN